MIFNGEAYQTVAGQNSNNSVRLSHDFFEAVDREEDWDLIRRTDGKVQRSIPAQGLWDQICDAAMAMCRPWCPV